MRPLNCDQIHGVSSLTSTHFLGLREVSLRNLTENFLGSMTETSFEDTPPLSSLIIDEDDEEEFDEEDLVDDRN